MVFIPRPESKKWELINNELIITQYYNWDHSDWRLAHRVIPETCIIEPNKIVYYSLYYINDLVTVMNIDERGNLKYSKERTFDKLIGTINKIKITIGFFIDNIENYSSERYCEHLVREEYKFNDDIKRLHIECFVDRDNILDYYIIYE